MKEEGRKFICETVMNYMEATAWSEILEHMRQRRYREMWQALERLGLLLMVKERFCRGVEGAQA